jgi:NADPH:quinone reductase-like Zn-dependent oxidoreductase
MKAAVIHEFGPPEVLVLEDWPDPSPAPGELLVRVGAVRVGGLLDVGTRAGKNPFAKITFPHVLGSDFAGEVVAVAAGVTGFAIGDRVAATPFIFCHDCAGCREQLEYACSNLMVVGVHRQGSYAELCAVPARNASRIPPERSYQQAAALAVSGPVALTQLRAAGVEPDDWVLVAAAASGLGAVTAQVAKRMGARVIGTSRKDWKLRELERFGLDAAINSDREDFVQSVRELTGGAGVKVVVDNVSARSLFAKLIAVLARRGTLVSSGAAAAETVELDLRSFYTLSQRVLGIRTLTLANVSEFWKTFGASVEPLIDTSFPLAEAPEAHRRVERGESLGRVLLSP